MGGAQPLAATMNGAAFLGIDVDPERIKRRVKTGYCDVMVTNLDEALRILKNAVRKHEAVSVGLVGNCADIIPELARRGVVPDVLTDQTSAHDPLNGYVPNGVSLDAAASSCARKMPMNTKSAPWRPWLNMSKACSICKTSVQLLLITEIISVPSPMSRASKTLTTSPVLCPHIFVPCFAKARAHSDGRHSLAKSRTLRAPINWYLKCSARRTSQPLDKARAKTRTVSGLAGAYLLARIWRADKFGLALNELVARGELKAPIVIGRDHLDCGSVASPYRETESMLDGSDAIADWPLLNALLNTASGASWVSIHNGGGVGIGYSRHSGQVTVADGTKEMAARIERVLTNDPGIGVARHIDAGYPEAKAFAKNTDLKIPML